MQWRHIASEWGPILARVAGRDICALEKRDEVRMTRLRDSVRCFVLQITVYWLWIAFNVDRIPRLAAFGSAFDALAKIALAGGIILSTFILIPRNPMTRLLNRHANLNPQVFSVFAEYTVTRLIQMTARIGERLGIDAQDPPDSYRSTPAV